MKTIRYMSERRRQIVDRHADHRNSVFVAGASRNSTALICDALSADGHYRYLFEPFSDMSEPSTALNSRMVWRDYVSPESTSVELLRHTAAILTGQVHTAQVDRWTPSGLYTKRLISECRLNLWLKWLRLNFEGMPIVLVMRHPCAAVSSRLLLERDTRLRILLQNAEFVARYLAPFTRTIEAAKSPVERHALRWAIEHYVPLQEFPGDSLHLVQYERFLEQTSRYDGTACRPCGPRRFKQRFTAGGPLAGAS